MEKAIEVCLVLQMVVRWKDQRSVAPIPQRMVDARLSCTHRRQRFINLVELTPPQAERQLPYDSFHLKFIVGHQRLWAGPITCRLSKCLRKPVLPLHFC
jgi:hypothetical protein